MYLEIAALLVVSFEQPHIIEHGTVLEPLQ